MIAGLEYKKLDIWLIVSYIALTMIGWISIFSAVYDPEHADIFDVTQRYGMQFIWITTSYVIAFLVIFVINPRLYRSLSWLAYAGSIFLLIAVIFFGIEVNGSNSWFEFGPVRFQPAEVSKIATTLALGSFMSSYGFKLKSTEGILKIALIILLPMAIIVMQKETGSALVYTAFIFMLYREGLSGWYLGMGIYAVVLFLITLSFSPFAAIVTLTATLVIARGIFHGHLIKHLVFFAFFFPAMIYSPEIQNIEIIENNLLLPDEGWLGIVIAPALIAHIYMSLRKKCAHLWYITLCFITSILLIFSVEILFEKVLQPHQKARIENLLGINVDLQGAGYNVHQSKIAIGSGGFSGKGFLQGTQTKFNFVPEQSTDFIFCTVGEEWGFLGSFVVISLFLFIIIRIILLADKHKDPFNRIYGYSLASILFMHFLINIGMTIGLMPVIGIPLPFVSYGGSSMWSFTLFLFIFIRLDLDRRR